MGGAIYVGTIVGPSGKAPMFELTTIENIKEITFKDSDEVRQGEGAWNISNKSLVPGKTDSEFNDNIAWSYITIRDEHGTDNRGGTHTCKAGTQSGPDTCRKTD